MWSIPALVAGLLLVSGGVAASALGENPDAGEVERGRRLYEIHCVSCHGQDGRGDGPMREVLGRRPTDLTHLDARGSDWLEGARGVLTGSSGRWLGAHGRREMPVWGASFVDRGRVGEQREEVEAEIDSLLAFLRILQASPPPHP